MARVFTAGEAAEYRHVTPRTIRKWVREGLIPGRRIGHVYQLLEAELEDMLRGRGKYRQTNEIR